MVKRRTALPNPPEDNFSGQGLPGIICEVFGLMLLFWAAFLMLSLLSYNPQDPSINHAISRNVPIQNSGGMFGAYISGLLVDMFGLAALVWPLAFCVWGAACVSSWVSMPWWRWAGFTLLGICLATLGAVSDISLLDVHGGGVFGLRIAEQSTFLFGKACATLIWLFSFFLSLELCFGIPWMTLLILLWSFIATQLEKHGITLTKLRHGLHDLWHDSPHAEKSAHPIALVDLDEDDLSGATPPRLSYGDMAAAVSAHSPAGEVKKTEPLWLPDFSAEACHHNDAVTPVPDSSSDTSSRGHGEPTFPDPFAIPADTPSFSGQQDSLHGSFTLHSMSEQTSESSNDDVSMPDTSDSNNAANEELLASMMRRMKKNTEGPNCTDVSRQPNVTLSAPVPSALSETASVPSADCSSVADISATPPCKLPANTQPVQPLQRFSSAQSTPAATQSGPLPGEVPQSFFDELDRALAEGNKPNVTADATASTDTTNAAMHTALAEGVQSATATSQPKVYRLPSTDLLQPPSGSDEPPSRELMRIKGEQLMSCLADFNISAELVRITPGPVVTMFELRPAPGIKVSRILGLNEDIALKLRALAVRIQTMPGSDTVGVEIPNERRATVNFRTILESSAFSQSETLLTLSLGVNIGGVPVVADLAKMPHLLVGGTTGSGKSVCINAFLLSLLYKARPDEVKLLMVDPKRVELAMYADLPHLIHPVVNEPAIAKNALDWAVHEMEHRYDLLARLGVRKFDAYNARLKEMGSDRPPEFADFAPMPYLVIVVDELADLMMSAGKEVEASIVRLAQLARAAGIHLIVATQRPSVDVVTGLIKANFPSRVSFQVTNGHDSRTILDATGAELLLGKGDMLFKPSGSKPFRLHGPFVSDADVETVVNFWKAQAKPEYTIDFAEWGQPQADDPRHPGGTPGNAEDELYNEIVEFALSQGKNLSISKLQRQFRIGFNKAARFMEQMQQDGIIAPPGHANRSRNVIHND